MLNKLLITILMSVSIIYAQTNVDLISNLDDHHSAGYNDIWGYVDSSGTEYALLGVRNGTSIISLADPLNPFEIAFIPATGTIWRDIKVHEEYAYVVSDGASDGLQIIDLSQLPNTATLAAQLYTWFNSAHNIYIENGYAYVVGADSPGPGLLVLDLTDPVNPTQSSYYSGSNYIHDVYIWDDTLVACAEDTYDLVDITDKSNPQWISSSAAIPGIYAHSGWMTEDKRYFYATEEFNEVDITVWDLQDRTSWDLVIPSWKTPSNSLVHNLFVLGNYAHVSYYNDGYVVLDITDPLAPYIIGEYNTSDMWGCYPYLPSGITICSDQDDGLYVFQFTPANVPPTIIHTPIVDVLNSDPVTTTALIIDNGSIADANLRYRIVNSAPDGGWNIVTDSNGPSGNMYEFEIPGFGNLAEIEYYISAQDDSDSVSTAPSGGSGINPPGSTEPSVFFSYIVRVPGQPIIEATSPAGDTTITVGAFLSIEVFAADTSGLGLQYSWAKNGAPLSFTGNLIPFIASPAPEVPRTDTIAVFITNGFFTNSYTWQITVESPTDVSDNDHPSSYTLYQNYPNPFNPSTQINFSIANPEFVNLSVYNSLGEKVHELVNEYKPAGEYTVTFNAIDLSSGIYVTEITAGSFKQLIKMSLLK